MQEQIETLMRQNRRLTEGFIHTVPSPELYPFQWFWDSCFHAIILSYFDMEAARAELRSVTSRPLASGLIPHIIYWQHDHQVTNWGREMRGDILTNGWGTNGTSAITQPPVIAEAVWNLHTKETDNAFLYELYPRLKTHYEALFRERDATPSGLIGIINPDESGEDNSPRFDAAQGLPPVHSADENLDKRIERMEQNKTCNFNAKECMRHHFWVEDVSFNAIMAKNLHAMASIASEIGAPEDAGHFIKQAKVIEHGMRTFMRFDDRYYSLSGLDYEPIRIDTWNIFMPLYANLLTTDEAKTLVENHLLNPETFWTDFPVPSVSLQEESFTRDEDGFWRGPVWMVPNWFIYHGLKDYGYNDLAAELKQKSIALIEQSGFREHYHPETGAGLGAHDFTWGGLVLDMNE